CLAAANRTVGVTHHRVLWSPDFPLPGSTNRKRLASPGSDRPAGLQTLIHYTMLRRGASVRAAAKNAESVGSARARPRRGMLAGFAWGSALRTGLGRQVVGRDVGVAGVVGHTHADVLERRLREVQGDRLGRPVAAAAERPAADQCVFQLDVQVRL